MFVQELRDAVARVGSLVAALAPDTVTGPAAVELVDAFAALERLAGAGKAFAAARAADTNQWRHGPSRSAADWLARRTGSTVSAARSAIDTATRVRSLPATEEALRNGELSLDQAGTVSDAASVAPEREHELLAAAKRENLRELRERAARVKAAATPEPAARRGTIHRERSLREWVDEHDVWHLSAKGTKDDGARFMARLHPFVDDAFRAARAAGRHESGEAYAFDGLLVLSESGGSSKPPGKVLVRADLSALRRGRVDGDEVCEIAGFGPVGVDVVREMLGESALALVLTNGVDVVNVTHFGRRPTAHQQTALEWSQPQCEADGCTATVRLQRDHVIEWSTTRHTRLDELQHLCAFHHAMKTRGDPVGASP